MVQNDFLKSHFTTTLSEDFFTNLNFCDNFFRISASTILIIFGAKIVGVKIQILKKKINRIAN